MRGVKKGRGLMVTRCASSKYGAPGEGELKRLGKPWSSNAQPGIRPSHVIPAEAAQLEARAAACCQLSTLERPPNAFLLTMHLLHAA
jgi:hypothetical protein